MPHSDWASWGWMEVVWVPLKQAHSSAALATGWNMEGQHCQGPAPRFNQFSSPPRPPFSRHRNMFQWVPTRVLQATTQPKWKLLNCIARRCRRGQPKTSKSGEGWQPLDKSHLRTTSGRERADRDRHFVARKKANGPHAGTNLPRMLFPLEKGSLIVLVKNHIFSFFKTRYCLFERMGAFNTVP